ncbi:MAG: metal ABC transporter substrate-binding protein [Deltaproteobacteria bacterium]|nr:metal ABC transporter substrate-binding protein [Deltaproteobacteria bacterium]
MRWVISILLCLFLLPGPAGAGQPLKVVASFSILGDMVKNVGGDRVKLTTLVGPDSDTHAYEPTPTDARALAGADVVIINGLGFEGWIDRMVKTAGYRGKIIIASRGVKTHTMIDEDHGGKRITDPHAWQNLTNGRIYVTNIEQARSQADPAGTGVFKANAEAYLKKIAEMETWVKAELAKIPPARRKIITSHDAFGYFGLAYGVTILAPTGFSTASEASAQNVGKLIRQIKQEKIKALFVENMTDPRLIERIAKDAGAKPGGTLYSDALSKPDAPGATYLEMFRNNVTKMTSAMTIP